MLAQLVCRSSILSMEENMNLDRGRQHYRFIDFMGVGDDYEISLVEQKLDGTPENMDLSHGSQYEFIDFMRVGDDDIDIDGLLPQEHQPQRDVDDGLLADTRACNLLQLLPTAKVERSRPEDRSVRLHLDLRLLPESSVRLLRGEGPSKFLSLQVGPNLDPALDPTSDPGPVTAEA